MVILGYGFEGGEDYRGKLPFSSHFISSFYLWSGLIYVCWYWPWSSGWGSVSQVFTIKLLFSLHLILYSLEGSRYAQPMFEEWGVIPLLLFEFVVFIGLIMCFEHCVWANPWPFSAFFLPAVCKQMQRCHMPIFPVAILTMKQKEVCLLIYLGKGFCFPHQRDRHYCSIVSSFLCWKWNSGTAMAILWLWVT